MSLAVSLACFKKQAKLLKAADYNHVFDKPARSSDRYFTVLARPNNLLHARLGLAFTKKRVKLAVARNRLKRISRESFRLSQSGTKELGCGLYCFGWRVMHESDQSRVIPLTGKTLAVFE